jgi:hypothetical protein
VIHTFNPSYSGVRVRRILVQARQKCEALPEKQTKLKKRKNEAEGMSKVVRHLLIKREALSSNPSTAKK